MKFYTKWSRPVKIYSKSGGKRITETKSFIPAKQQIENMILAGQRLSAFRTGMYDFGPNDKIDYDYIDPTRNPNFDLADASRIKAEITAKMEEYNNAVAAKKESTKESSNNSSKDSDNDVKKSDSETKNRDSTS
jgi:hypothetical protein